MLSEGHDGGSLFAEARPQDATLNHRPERACLLGLRMEEAKESAGTRIHHHFCVMYMRSIPRSARLCYMNNMNNMNNMKCYMCTANPEGPNADLGLHHVYLLSDFTYESIARDSCSSN